MLKEFVRQWDNHKMLVYWMRKIFNYLDRYYLKNGNMESLCQTGLKIFKEQVFNKVNKSVTDATLKRIYQEREKEHVDWHILRDTILGYVQLGLVKADIVKNGEDLFWKGEKDLAVYEKSFEEQFIKESKDYYTRKAQQWISSLNCPEYLQAAEDYLVAEERRADNYLEPQTKPKLLDVAQSTVVEKHAQGLAEMEGTGCKTMFTHKKLEELKLMYLVFRRVETTKKYILNEMSPYIENRGDEIIKNENLLKDPIQFTGKLLELKNEMDEMVEQSFANDAKFQKSRDQSFQNFMNRCPQTPNYIASYCDNEFRRGLKGVSEQDTESRLEAIIRLFCCLHARDVFIKSYTRFLSSRLLNKSSISNEAEHSMLGKLKVECGHNTVNKLTHMFTDMDLSKDLMGEFKAKFKDGVINGITVQAEVLTNGYWPEQGATPLKLPPELQTAANKFEEFYKYKHSGRHLTWLFNHGQLEVNPTWTSKKFIFVATMYQTVILFLFNQQDTWTHSEIFDYLGLPKEELHNQLMYLFNPKQKILLKENQKVPQCQPSEKIRVNLDFQHANVKVSFVPTVKHTKPNLEKTDREKGDEKEIKQERQNIIDAVIVRIMKARKTEKHNELMTECIR